MYLNAAPQTVVFQQVRKLGRRPSLQATQCEGWRRSYNLPRSRGELLSFLSFFLSFFFTLDMLVVFVVLLLLSVNAVHLCDNKHNFVLFVWTRISVFTGRFKKNRSIHTKPIGKRCRVNIQATRLLANVQSEKFSSPNLPVNSGCCVSDFLYKTLL